MKNWLYTKQQYFISTHIYKMANQLKIVTRYIIVFPTNKKPEHFVNLIKCYHVTYCMIDEQLHILKTIAENIIHQGKNCVLIL